MKATLEFKLPEDAVAHKLACKADDFWGLYWDAKRMMYEMLLQEAEENDNTARSDMYSVKIHSKFCRLCDQYGISDDLIDVGGE